MTQLLGQHDKGGTNYLLEHHGKEMPEYGNQSPHVPKLYSPMVALSCNSDASKLFSKGNTREYDGRAARQPGKLGEFHHSTSYLRSESQFDLQHYGIPPISTRITSPRGECDMLQAQDTAIDSNAYTRDETYRDTSFPTLPFQTYRPHANEKFSHIAKITISNASEGPTIVRAAWSLLLSRYLDTFDIILREVSVYQKDSVSSKGLPRATTHSLRVVISLDQKLNQFLNEIQANTAQSWGQGWHNNHYPHNVLTITEMESDHDDSFCEVDDLACAFFINVRLCSPGVHICVQFDNQVITLFQVQRIAYQMDHIIHQINEPGSNSKCLRDIEIASPQDKEQILSWNSEPLQYIDACVHDYIQERAREFPNDPAIYSWDAELTYGQLEEMSDRLAPCISNYGVSPGSFVSLCFEKSAWAVVSILATMKAGAAFVLIDPQLPLNRIRSVIDDVDSKLILCSKSQERIVTEIQQNYIAVELLLLQKLPLPAENQKVSVSSRNAVYATFTSGSTGKPKGVVIEHGQCLSGFLAQIQKGLYTKSSRVFQFSSFAFDVSVEDILATLLAGGCICMPSEKDRLENLTISINKTKANHIQVPTSVATLLPPEGLPGLRTLRQGGEAMSAVLVEKWLSVTNIQNSYGPCECTVSSSIQLYPNPENPGNVGVGVGCFLWIADTMNSSSILNMAPIGAVGELLIQGPLVGRGYINRPDENSRAFIKNCFLPADHPAANFSVYRTGDLARYSEDGSINLLGRKDHQVKLRGQRIELGEIESLLSMQQNLDFAVCDVANTGAFKGLLVSPVQFVKDEKKIGGGEELKILDEALRPGLKQQLREIYRNLEETLPSFMIPILIPVAKFPFLLTGKVDRKSVKHWLNGINLETKTKIERGIMEGEMSSEADCDYAIISRDLAQKISSLIPGGKTQPQADLGFDDFLLKSSGLDSIQTVTLWRLLKDEYRVSIPISVLNSPLLSVKRLAKYITSGAAGDEWEMHQNQNLALELSSLKTQLRSWTKRFLLRKVFLTGATGYLGSFILKSLLTSSHIGRVIVHVRAPTPKDGLSRVKNSAQVLHWWDEKFISKVEIWTGDLALPRLGLDEQHWQKLTATNDSSQIDAIVHCGARVNWTQDYHSLRSVNVLSTLNLLQAFLKSDGSRPLKFVYVSGGCQWSIGEDTDKLLTEQLKTCDNGYGQTKLMSELLVRSAVNGSPSDKLIIMKPSFIIGSPSHGTANVDDFFWRVILSSIQIGLYDEEVEESWVFVTSAERIADLVFQGLVGNHDDPGLVVTKAFDGIPLNQLWQILRNDFGYTLHPMKHEAWLKAIHDRIEIEREKHPLWPLSHMIHSDFCRLGCDTSESTPFSNHERMQYVKASFVKSVEYLISIGYLPKTCGKKEERISVPVFSRSTLTR